MKPTTTHGFNTISNTTYRLGLVFATFLRDFRFYLVEFIPNLLELGVGQVPKSPKIRLQFIHICFQVRDLTLHDCQSFIQRLLDVRNAILQQGFYFAHFTANICLYRLDFDCKLMNSAQKYRVRHVSQAWLYLCSERLDLSALVQIGFVFVNKQHGNYSQRYGYDCSNIIYYVFALVGLVSHRFIAIKIALICIFVALRHFILMYCFAKYTRMFKIEGYISAMLWTGVPGNSSDFTRKCRKSCILGMQ